MIKTAEGRAGFTLQKPQSAARKSFRLKVFQRKSGVLIRQTITNHNVCVRVNSVRENRRDFFDFEGYTLPIFSNKDRGIPQVPILSRPIWEIVRMPRMSFQVGPRIGLVILSALPFGCTHFDPVTGSTLAGSGLGATTGAIIGHQSGHTGTGALIGAAAGALGGALVGDARQARAERDSAYAYADAQAQQAALGAVTNTDVIYMAQNNLGEDVIINAIQTRGGRFDTSPQSLIYLKTSGVSDRVIAVMQNTGAAIAPVSYIAPPPPPRPSIVIVEPSPPRPIYFGHFGGHHYHPCRPHRYRESSISLHGHF